MSFEAKQQRKIFFPINDAFREYLSNFRRARDLPVIYEDMLQYEETFPLIDKDGKDTLWLTLKYEQQFGQELYEGLKRIYVMLRSDGDERVLGNLFIDRVDYCTFGNTKPMRVRVVNQHNDNHDYFYVKKADASRVYGLELEELLSPNDINFMVCGDTLIEEHIIGVPGDDFIRDYLPRRICIPCDWQRNLSNLTSVASCVFWVTCEPIITSSKSPLILNKTNIAYVQSILINSATKEGVHSTCHNSSRTISRL